MSKCALIMAGGTGGHIFPALALALALRQAGWRVHWLGGAGHPGQPSMEAQLVPKQGFAFEAIDFGGLRGKGFATALLLPWRLLRACWQGAQVLRRLQPDVVVGMGGYISFPAGLMAKVMGRPLILHEQNAVAGLTNRLLAKLAWRVFSAFPAPLRQAHWIGNPLRLAFLQQPAPQQRFAARSGALKLLVLGGSQGARVLNEVVPKALALLAEDERPQVLHQGGVKQIEALRAHYAQAKVAAELLPFIEDTAQAMAQADLVLCRSGASTVTELAAVGAAALLVPLPSAVDDHQSKNARFLVDQGAAWLLPQSELTPAYLAQWLRQIRRVDLLDRAVQAKKLQQIQATEHLLAACEQAAKGAT